MPASDFRVRGETPMRSWAGRCSCATGKIHYGRVPAGSVVVSGNLPSPDGKYGLYCAVIVKKVDAKTRTKTSLNELLRGD